MNAIPGKGGSDAAFPFFPPAILAVAVFSALPGVSQSYPLAFLRASGFCAALPFLFRPRLREVAVSGYPALLALFVLFALGHAVFAAYTWVSVQHVLNLATAVSLFMLFSERFRAAPERWWKWTVLLVAILGCSQGAIAFGQRILFRVPRPAGTFGNANYLAEFLAAGAILAAARLLFNDQLSRRVRATLASTALTLAASSLALAGSRGVLLATVPAVGLLLSARFGLRKGLGLLATAGIPALLALGLPALSRFGSTDIYNYSRIAIWKAAFSTFMHDPFGVGLGGFKYFWIRFQEPIPGAFRLYYKTADTAHNEYLEVLTGLGAIGFLIFCGILLTPLITIARRLPSVPAERKGNVAGAAACLVLSGVNALFNANFHEPGIFILDAWLLALLFAQFPPRSPRMVRVPPIALRFVGGVASILLLASAGTVVAAAAHEFGQASLRKGNRASAETAFRIAVSFDPLRALYPDALSALRFREYRQDRSQTKSGSLQALDESIRLERRAARLGPVESTYPARLALLFVERYRLTDETGDLIQAERSIREAIRLAPFSIERLWQQADILELAGRRSEAVAVLRRAVEIEPNFCQGYARLSGMTALSDPSDASDWTAKAAACRSRAEGRTLEIPERWMLEVRFADGG